MSEGLWWRKVRRNVIRDDILRTVAEELDDDSLRPLVLTFYMVAYMQADDDGVFEFVPKVFRRLMYAPHVDDVIAIKDALCAEGAIKNILGGNNEKIDNFFLITDWIDVQDGSRYNVRPSLTADQRRGVVARKIAGEQKTHYGAARVAQTSRREIVAASKLKADSPAPVVQVDFSSMPPADFGGAPQNAPDGADTPPQAAVLNDKNAESVDTKNLNDTFPENVDTDTVQDSTAQDSTGQDSTGQDTAVRSSAQADTGQESDTTGQDGAAQNLNRASRSEPRSGALAQAAAPPAVAGSTAEYSQESGTTGGEIFKDDAEKRILKSKRLGIYAVLDGFFGKFGKYALEKGEFEQFLLLCDLCYSLSSKKNDPRIVASMLVAQLKKLYPEQRVRPSEAAEPSILLYLVEELRRLLGVDDEQVQKAVAGYNGARDKAVKSLGKQKGKAAQNLAEQAIKDDGG